MKNNIIKIQDIRDLQLNIHDFHVHMDENIETNLLEYNVKSICIMPTWKTLETINFSKNNVNDFTNPTTYLKNLENIEKTFHEWKGKIYKFIPVDFSKTQNEFSDIIEKIKPAGIKLHPLQNFKIDKQTLDQYFAIAQEKKLIVYIHTDWIPSTEWRKMKGTIKKTFEKIVKLYPNIKFIMGHAGNNDSYLLIWKLFKKYPNIYAETSLSPTPQELEKIIYKIDKTEKIDTTDDTDSIVKGCVLFGSNFPFSSTSVEITKILKMKRVTESDKKAVLYNNALELLKNSQFVEVE